jgi:hypothetical protein
MSAILNYAKEKRHITGKKGHFSALIFESTYF